MADLGDQAMSLRNEDQAMSIRTLDQAMPIRTLDLQVLLMEEPWTSTLVSYIATIANTLCMFCYQGECLPQAVRALSL